MPVAKSLPRQPGVRQPLKPIGAVAKSNSLANFRDKITGGLKRPGKIDNRTEAAKRRLQAIRSKSPVNPREKVSR